MQREGANELHGKTRRVARGIYSSSRFRCVESVCNGSDGQAFNIQYIPGTPLMKRRTLRWPGYLAVGLLACGSLFFVPEDAQAQEIIVRGRVLHNPMMSDCWQSVPCTREVVLTREEDWVPTPAAVNVVVQGTGRVSKTDPEGYYEISVPSPDASLMFLYIGHNRIEVPIAGRSVIDARLTPTPLP